MRVAFVIRSNNSSTGSSNRVSRRMIRNILKENDDLFIHAVVGKGFKPDELRECWYDYVNSDRFQVHQVMMDTKPMLMTNIMTEDLYHLINQDSKRSIVLDGVVNSAFGLSLHISYLLEYVKFQRQISTAPFLVTWNLFGGSFMMAKKQPAFWRSVGHVLLEATGILQSDHVIHESKQLESWLMDTYRPYFKFSVLNQISNHSSVVYNGIDLQAVPKRGAPFDRKVVPFWGGGINHEKGFMESISACGGAYKLGLIDDYLMTTYVGPNHPKAQDVLDALKGVGGTLRFKQSEDAFHDALNEGDVFVCATELETYGLAWLEMLYAGMIGVFVAGSGMEKVLPPDYPYIVKNVSEAKNAVIEIARDYKDIWDSLIPGVRRHIEREHDSRMVASRFVSVLRDVNEKRKKFNGGKAAEVLRNSGLISPATISDARQHVSALLTDNAVYELMQSEGWNDDCKSVRPSFFK